MIRRIRGTEDILPSVSPVWNYVEEVARDLMMSYGFKEIRTPIFETFDLFARSVGDTTDIVSKEMYDFHDKGDRHLALRPEGTAGIARAFAEHKLYGPEFNKPYKVYYIGPMFRYERPQAGRQRQFHQLGVEVFESKNPAIDAETIALAWDYLTELGLDNLTLYINSLGQADARQAYRQALVDYFTPLKEDLSEDSKRRLEDNPLRIIDSKHPKDQALAQDAPSILDFLSLESQAHFEAVKEILDTLEIPYQVDPTIVRGLDYYQETIFEIIVDDDSIGAQSTVCGGGRYDGLVEEIGGPSTPGFGFAIGLERLLLILDQQAVKLPIETAADLYVLTMGEEANVLASQIVQAARQEGLVAERNYTDRSMRAQFKTADRMQAKLVTTLGENEVQSGIIQLKNQENNKQVKVSVEELLEDFTKIYRQLTVDTSVIDQYFRGEF